MKNLPKIFIIVSISLLLTQIFSISYFVLAPAASAADFKIEAAVLRVPFWDLPSKLQNFSVDKCKCTAAEKATKPEFCAAKEQNFCLNIPWIAMYIGAAYRYGVVIGSVLAVMMIMIGGIMYILGGYNQNMISRGRDFMTGAVVGLFLLLGSYIILNTVNPNLIYLKPLEIEMAKEDVLMSGKYCSQAEQQGFVVEKTDWKDTNTCGQSFSLKLSEKNSDGGMKTGGEGQTCISDSCGNTNLACVQDVKTGQFSCKSVIVYGTISYPGTMDQISCGNITQAVLTNGFYLDSLQLFAVPPSFSGLPENLVPLTSQMFWGKGKYQYYIEKKDLISANIQDNYRIILKTEVNDSTWPMWVTIDDDFYVAGMTKNFSGANEISAINFCWVDGKAKVLGVEQKGGGFMYYNIPELTWGELKNNPKGINWNIDITAKLFNCSEGETSDANKKMDCKYASQLATGGDLSGGKGVACKKASDCQANLTCNGKGICAEPIAANQPCADTKDCASGLYCSNLTNVCSAYSAGIGQSCDTKVAASCGEGLYCDDNSDSCVLSPAKCSNSYQCKGGVIEGWEDGSCDGGYCDCLYNSDCTNGYICADNTSGLYNNNDSCVQAP